MFLLSFFPFLLRFCSLLVVIGLPCFCTLAHPAVCLLSHECPHCGNPQQSSWATHRPRAAPWEAPRAVKVAAVASRFQKRQTGTALLVSSLFAFSCFVCFFVLRTCLCFVFLLSHVVVSTLASKKKKKNEILFASQLVAARNRSARSHKVAEAQFCNLNPRERVGNVHPERTTRYRDVWLSVCLRKHRNQSHVCCQDNPS